jgi:hypothetical protein
VLVRALLTVLYVVAFGGGGGDSEPWAHVRPGWSDLTQAPFERSSAVWLWTGSLLLVWGGDTDYDAVHHDDGAIYDPVEDTWRVVPPGPLDGRSAPAAVWTGEEALVWGGIAGEPKGDGAAFDPAERSWRLLPEGPLTPRLPAAAVWTGRELLVWGDTNRFTAALDGAAFDPGTNGWRSLPRAPRALNEVTAVWTGSEMIVLGALLDGGNHSTTETARAIAYRPAADAWRELPPPPLSPQASAAVWTGGELIAWDYDLAAAAYDPATDGWTRLPDVPLDFFECYPKGVQVAGLVLASHCGQAALFDPEARTWQELRPPGGLDGRVIAAGPVAILTGEVVRVFAPR